MGGARAIRTVLLFILAGFVPVAAFAQSSSAKAPAPPEVQYDITVQIDPVARRIEGRTVIIANTSEELTLMLRRRFEVMSASVDDSSLGPSATAGGMRGWRIAGEKQLPRRIEMHWRGELAALDTSLDHHQTLGRNEPASSEAGTFLPDSSGWYPHLADKLASYRVTINLPAGQRGLVAGGLVEESDSSEGYRARFGFPSPTGGIDLMAGPYTVESRAMRGTGGKTIRLRTYFHPQIADLAPAYLDAVKGYIELYESWIGAYPFTEFSVVSSPTPTGFGMPTLHISELRCCACHSYGRRPLVTRCFIIGGEMASTPITRTATGRRGSRLHGGLRLQGAGKPGGRAGDAAGLAARFCRAGARARRATLSFYLAYAWGDKS